MDLSSLLNDPGFVTGLGMLGSTQTPGAAFMQAAQQSRAMALQQQQLQAAQLANQMAQKRASFNPADYMISNRQPVPAAGPATTAALAATMGGAAANTIGGNAGATDQSMQAMQPPGAIGNIDYAGLLKAGTQGGMTPEEMQAAAQMMDPRTALLMRMAGQPAMAAAPGAAIVQPGLQAAQQLLNPGQPVQGQGGNPPGVLYQNGNLPPDSQAAQLGYLQKLRDAAPDQPTKNLYQAAIDKMSGKFEQGLQQQNQDIKVNQQGIQNQQKINDQVTGFSNNLQKTNIPQMESALKDLEDQMARYPKGQLPGVGTIQGVLPLPALDANGQRVRQDAETLRNITLHKMNGARITNPEIARNQLQMGLGGLMNEDRFRQGVAGIRTELENEKRNAQAGVSDDVLKQYETQGGMPLSYLRASSGGKTAPNPNVPGSGYSVSDIDAELAKRGAK